MYRAVAIIAAAIGLVSPSTAKDTRVVYAQLIRKASGCTATRCEIDPLTLVAFFWHEASWNPGAVGDGGRAIGLGQSWSWLYSKACKNDKDPIRNPSAACAAKRNALLSPAVAIRVTAGSIRKARKACKDKTGRSALFHRWLSLLGGRNHPRAGFKGMWCAQRQVTIGKGRKRRRVWRDVAWRNRKDRKLWRQFKGIREIIDCRRALTRRQRCHREGRSARASSR